MSKQLKLKGKAAYSLGVPRILKQRLRGEDRIPFAMVVALGPNQLGYSVCNAVDQFNSDIAFQIAYGRARSHYQIEKENGKVIKKTPDTAFEYWVEMITRSLNKGVNKYTVEKIKDIVGDPVKLSYINKKVLFVLRALKEIEKNAAMHFSNVDEKALVKEGVPDDKRI